MARRVLRRPYLKGVIEEDALKGLEDKHSVAWVDACHHLQTAQEEQRQYVGGRGQKSDHFVEHSCLHSQHREDKMPWDMSIKRNFLALHGPWSFGLGETALWSRSRLRLYEISLRPLSPRIDHILRKAMPPSLSPFDAVLYAIRL